VERRDVLIVLVGALLVGGATAYAAVSGPVLGEFRVTYGVAHEAFQLQPTGNGGPVGAFTIEATKALVRGNLTLVHFEGEAAGTGALPPTATMHATLKAPNGAAWEKDVSVAPGAASMVAAFDVALAPVPANATLRAADAAAVAAQLPAPTALGNGTWTLTLIVSTGAPNVVPFGVRASGYAESYAAAVSVAPAAAK
jgi:hypothetical protein